MHRAETAPLESALGVGCEVRVGAPAARLGERRSRAQLEARAAHSELLEEAIGRSIWTRTDGRRHLALLVAMHESDRKQALWALAGALRSRRLELLPSR